MTVWRYNSLYIKYELRKAPGSREKLWTWVSTVDGTELLGLGAILDGMGAYGWELVSTFPTWWQDKGGGVYGGAMNIEAVTAIFKRPE